MVQLLVAVLKMSQSIVKLLSEVGLCLAVTLWDLGGFAIRERLKCILSITFVISICCSKLKWQTFRISEEIGYPQYIYFMSA